MATIFGRWFHTQLLFSVPLHIAAWAIASGFPIEVARAESDHLSRSSAVEAPPASAPDEQALTPDAETATIIALHLAEIERLEAAVSTAANRDSLRFLLAIAWRGTGTVEGRQKARELFQKIRSRYNQDPRYHVELARTYLDGNRREEARKEFELAMQLDPGNMEARLLVVQTLRERTLRYWNAEEIADALPVIEETVALAPENMEARLEYAVCLQLAGMVAAHDRAPRSLAVLQQTETALAIRPASSALRSLQAVALFDLGRPVEADRVFREVFGEADTEVDGIWRDAPTPDQWARKYVSRDGVTHDGATSDGATHDGATSDGSTRDSTTPESAMHDSTTPDTTANGTTTVRDALDWSKLDPTPLTPVNEAQLEYWRRLVLADRFYGEPEKSLRGWMTPRGELFVRYGPPQALTFQNANWEEAEATTARDLGSRRAQRGRPTYAPFSSAAPFSSPIQRWAYVFDGREMTFDFTDPTFQGDFIPLDRLKHAEQTRELPIVLLGTSVGDVPTYYFASSGSRDTKGTTRQRVSLAIPSGESDRQGLDSPSPDALRPHVRVLDAAGIEVKRASLEAVTETSLDAAGTRLMLVSARGELLLAPGRYSAEVGLDSESSSGSFVVPFVVRDFGRQQLLISDLDFVFPPDAPNPGGLATATSRLRVRYEAYNFTPGEDGKVRYRTRFTVVPREYAVAATRLLETPDAEVDASIYLGGLGQSLEGVTLHARNFVDVLFPEKEEPLAPGSRGGFTFELDPSTLEPGEYALTVFIEDRIAHVSTLAQAAIRILGQAETLAIGGSQVNGNVDSK